MGHYPLLHQTICDCLGVSHGMNSVRDSSSVLLEALLYAQRVLLLDNHYQVCKFLQINHLASILLEGHCQDLSIEN